MRPWTLLLLLSLLVSDLSPLRDGDGVMENWTLHQNLLLNGEMTPRGPEILQIQTQRCCMCMQRNRACVCTPYKLGSSPLYTVNTVYGCSLSLKDLMGINRSQTPALVAPLLPALHRRHAAAAWENARTPMKMIKDLLFSGSAWFLHHLSAASGCNFQASLAEKSKSWRPAIVVWLGKVLTERYGAAETEVISCCFKGRRVKQALSIRDTSKRQILKGHRGSKKRVMGFKVLIEPSSKGFVNQYDSFKAASLHPLDKSQPLKQRKEGRIIKIKGYLNFFLQKSVQKQQPLTTPTAYDDDDGFYVKRKLLLVPREKLESINKPQYKIRATLDDNKEDFSGKIITEQAELQRPEGTSATERSHTHIEKGKQERLAYKLQAGFTDKTDNNDDKQMPSEVGDDILIVFFLPDAERETQTGGKLAKDAGCKWKTVNIPIKELDDPPPLYKVIEENFIIKAHNSNCKHLKESLFLLEIYAARGDIKPAKVTTKCAKTQKQVRVTTEKTERAETNNTRRENMSINHTKQDAPSEDLVIPSPPSIKMTELEAAKRERAAETTTVNTEIKETTSRSDVFNQSGTQEEDGPPSTTTASPDSRTDTEPRFTRRTTTDDVRVTSGESFSGLRMRADFWVGLQKGWENKRDGVTRQENEPAEDSFSSAESLETIHKQDTQRPLGIHDNMPPCRGLIHRTEAGWKHCMERYSRAGSKMFSSGEPTGAFKEREELQNAPPSIREHQDTDDDEYDHFYYFDGAQKRVQNNFYPSYQRQRRRERRSDNTKTNVFTEREKDETYGNLLSSIRRFSSREEDSHSKRSHAEDLRQK